MRLYIVCERMCESGEYDIGALSGTVGRLRVRCVVFIHTPRRNDYVRGIIPARGHLRGWHCSILTRDVVVVHSLMINSSWACKVCRLDRASGSSFVVNCTARQSSGRRSPSVEKQAKPHSLRTTVVEARASRSRRVVRLEVEVRRAEQR